MNSKAAAAIVLFFAFLPRLSFSQKTNPGEISPAGLAAKMIHNPAFVENAKGENFCWHARVDMYSFVENYQLTKNTAWLDAAVTYFDFLVAKMDVDPDGYKGWIGPYEYDGKYWQDALVGDAILIGGILDFCVLVLEDGNLKTKYGIKADSYVAIAKRDFIEKWEKRGTWYDDGPYGSYIGFNKFLDPANPHVWLTNSKVSRAGISHPFNKQMDVGQVCLRLYRITGDRFYKDRAIKIYFTAKSHFQYCDNHYCWNYFEPLTPGDVDLEKQDTRHGVWVHPWRSGYQASEVEKIAEAYHYGIVFNEQDIRRIINTNLEVMWNKDKTNPVFISSNGLGADHDTTGMATFRATYGHSTEFKNAGELWTGLLDFDQRIRDLYELQFKGGKHPAERRLYENTVLKTPPGFRRKFTKEPPVIPLVEFTDCKDLCLATVLPHTIKKNEKSIIICKSRVSGDLRIDLYTTERKQVLNLYQGTIKEGIFLITWDGKDATGKTVLKGDAKIRWTINGGVREFPIQVKSEK